MKHFPIFLAVEDQMIAVSGGGEAAMAKLRLLLKTEARITVYAPRASATIRTWADEGRLTLVDRALAAGDADGARLVYAANDDDVVIELHLDIEGL